MAGIALPAMGVVLDGMHMGPGGAGPLFIYFLDLARQHLAQDGQCEGVTGGTMCRMPARSRPHVRSRHRLAAVPSSLHAADRRIHSVPARATCGCQAAVQPPRCRAA
ncbi:hypothetical protein AMK31_35220 [Streptomyces sp. TSRI0107]|nr:hypothetical protein AMK31_35220 [Streptomyces sp. TSRI0107]